MKARFSPSRDRYYVILADRFASRTYSLKKNKLGDGMIKQLLIVIVSVWQIKIFCSTSIVQWLLSILRNASWMTHHERQINIRQLFANLNIEEHLKVSIGSFEQNRLSMMIIGNFSNEEGDGNKSFQNGNRLVTKNKNFARASLFFCTFFLPSLHD